MAGRHLQWIVLGVLKLNIWYLSQRQAQRYSLDDDTAGSMSPYKSLYSFETAFIYMPFAKGAPSPWILYTSLPPKTTTSTFVCIVCPYKAATLFTLAGNFFLRLLNSWTWCQFPRSARKVSKLSPWTIWRRWVSTPWCDNQQWQAYML